MSVALKRCEICGTVGPHVHVNEVPEPAPAPKVPRALALKAAAVAWYAPMPVDDHEIDRLATGHLAWILDGAVEPRRGGSDARALQVLALFGYEPPRRRE